MHLSHPPQLRTGQPLEYYKQRCSELHDSSFPGTELFIGRIILGDSSRVVQLHMKEGNAVIVSIAVAQGDKLEGISLNLPSHRIKDENFVVLYWGDDGIDTIEWWDPEYWDQASFIEATYP